ncbi:hypothetical protein [Halomonas elongata]|uniref:Uncharacterized protein n=1 Tax=Halomonas elongata (strain ATCC 33173 / DSM 2581 / NBRC 15536 / NCIMB 2198 / 1H9) TaxID=768066 RepID=E1VA78_HALED|nr:hypothetical protein [Halomonas elongata]WPU46555.1 hypothetical protein SR933_15045 [Halomonas elongata DSM 2581]CBV43966.1 uncharacterized protein HELO_4082 [Halomonas elongata DSM 2581]
MMLSRYALLLALGMVTAVPAYAIDREQGLERVREQLMQSCAEGGMASCLGVETSRCGRLAEEVVQACAEYFVPAEQEQMAAFGDCIGRQTQQRTGVSEAELQSCQSHADGAAHASSSPEEAMRRLEDAKAVMAQDAEATRDAVTLPLYPDHELTAHHQDPSGLPGIEGEPLGEGAVPVAMMTTSDTVEDVVAFYQNRLDGFTLYREAADDATFAKGMPDDVTPSDFRRWMKALPLHEHVAIYRLSGKTHIEVGYQPD